MTKISIDTSAQTTQCGYPDPLCILDAHPALGPMIGTFVPFLIAAVGWWISNDAPRRAKQEIGKLADDAVDELLAVSNPVFQDSRLNRSVFAGLVDDVRESARVAALDELVSIPMEKWPSSKKYITARNLRDRFKVLFARLDSEESIQDFWIDPIAKILGDIDIAKIAYQTTRNPRWKHSVNLDKSTLRQ